MFRKKFSKYFYDVIEKKNHDLKISYWYSHDSEIGQYIFDQTLKGTIFLVGK